MTYFGFLARFLLPPLAILIALTWWDRRRGRTQPTALNAWPPLAVIAAHVVVAVLYTTPWDNYLVATRVWWYDPELVTGIVLGWVPIEEYTFFILQTIMTGLWVLWLMKRLKIEDWVPVHAPRTMRSVRLLAFAPIFLIWLGSIALLISRWQPGTYLALELVWALPPILLQLGFGADILWRNRRVVFWGVVPTTIYLCIGDALAIGAGTWTINPAQSTGLLVGNLPIEEILFFLLTNTLVVLGMTLVLARESQSRAPHALLDVLSAVVKPQKSAQSA